MTKRLAGYVHLSVNGGLVSYGPDDTVPAEHAALITNEKAWAPAGADALDDDLDDDEADESHEDKPRPARRRVSK